MLPHPGVHGLVLSVGVELISKRSVVRHKIGLKYEVYDLTVREGVRLREADPGQPLGGSEIPQAGLYLTPPDNTCLRRRDPEERFRGPPE